MKIENSESGVVFRTVRYSTRYQVYEYVHEKKWY